MTLSLMSKLPLTVEGASHGFDNLPYFYGADAKPPLPEPREHSFIWDGIACKACVQFYQRGITTALIRSLITLHDCQRRRVEGNAAFVGHDGLIWYTAKSIDPGSRGGGNLTYGQLWKLVEMYSPDKKVVKPGYRITDRGVKFLAGLQKLPQWCIACEGEPYYFAGGWGSASDFWTGKDETYAQVWSRMMGV